MNNIQKGKLGEEIATNYLVSKGAKILQNNYKLNFGEIDIIAKINQDIVFVEVKARSNLNFGYPAEAVNLKKQRKIRNVAKYFIVKNKLQRASIRFDVIEIYLKDKKINHIENAF